MKDYIIYGLLSIVLGVLIYTVTTLLLGFILWDFSLPLHLVDEDSHGQRCWLLFCLGAGFVRTYDFIW